MEQAVRHIIIYQQMPNMEDVNANTAVPPGSVEPDPWAFEPNSPISPGGRKSRNRPSRALVLSKLQLGVCGNVWVHNNDAWKLMHQFSTGLKLDTPTNGGNPAEAPQTSSLHLPATSIDALDHLRTCLHTRRSVEIDVELEGSDRAKELSDVLVSLVESQATLTAANRTEVKNKLAQRQDAVKHEDSGTPKLGKATGDEEAAHLAPSQLIAPETGQDAIDVAICPLSTLDDSGFKDAKAGRCPHLALGFASLKNKLEMSGASGTSVSVKYAALIICPMADASAFQFAHKLACTLAATFMDEHFAEAVRALPRERPEGLPAALDEYLSGITILPTVYMANKMPQKHSDGVPEREKIADYLLSESLVESMERKLCRQRGLKFSNTDLHGGKSEKRESMKVRRQFFMQINKFEPLEEAWTVTHRLRQGLEVEASKMDARPQMPSVSVSALTQVRQLMTPATVALNICCGHADMAAKIVVDQLGKAGLPPSALEDVSNALHSVSSPSTDDTKSFSFELLNPSQGDEACHVFVIPSVQLPSHNGFMGSFFRFSPSLGFPFAPLSLPIRFLFILVGPQSSSAELLSLGHALAVLATDEDLMAGLAAVSDNNAFINAIDVRLANLTFIPHAYLTTKISSEKKQAGRGVWDNVPGGTGGDADEDGAEPLTPKSHASVRRSREPASPKFKRSNSFSSSTSEATTLSITMAELEDTHSLKFKAMACWKATIRILQKYSLPLVVGVSMALVWANIDEHSYHDVTHGQIGSWEMVGHPVSLHFLVNDIFMVFFFGLAIKEVTEAVLPGGSLSPIRRAANPLLATIGGVVGPVVCYYLAVVIMEAAGAFDSTMCETPVNARRRLGGGGGSSSRGPMKMELCSLSTLLKGWGVPTATDISLAWMFALLIFGAGHPAINVLLLLAIVDDALGMVIIAVFYPNPEKPVEPIWLLLVLLAMIVSFAMRKVNFPYWQGWVLIPGPISWLGLIKAHVHPALALVFVVPFMPAIRARIKKKRAEGRLTRLTRAISKVVEALDQTPISNHGSGDNEQMRDSAVKRAAEHLLHHSHAPLHSFEHALKLPVDLGMFLFGLANAGVQMGSVGGITAAVLFALLVGKTLGIAGFGLLAMSLGFGLPTGVTVVDLFSMACLGGVGLTVALFVANEAFVDPGLQGQAKMGAVLSVGCAGFAWLIRVVGNKISPPPIEEEDELLEATFDPDTGEAEAGEWIDDFLVEDIMQIMWTHRQYKLRGMKMPMTRSSIRAASKEQSHRSGRHSVGGSMMGSVHSMDGSTLGVRRAASMGHWAPEPPQVAAPPIQKSLDWRATSSEPNDLVSSRSAPAVA